MVFNDFEKNKGIKKRKLLCGAAGVLAPLTDALKGPGKSLTWSPALDSAFCHAKDLLVSVPELVQCPSSP